MGTLKRLDPSKPEDLRKLVATGLIWNATVPVEYKQLAIDALVNGQVEPNDLIPADALNHINEQRNALGRPPIELAVTADDNGEGA